MKNKGEMIEQPGLLEEPYQIRVLNRDDLAQVLQFQTFIIDGMENDCLCVSLEAEEHLEIMNGKGESIGLFIQDQLRAVCSILFPGHRKDNMARELNFSHQELLKVSQLELSLVDPDLRGHNLQQKLAEILARRVKKRKEHRYLFTTVSPSNYPSIKTVTSMGLLIAKLSKMYYGWDRYVVYQDLSYPWQLDLNTAIGVAAGSAVKQQQLLSQGYLGFGLSNNAKDVNIMFAREVVRR